MVVACCDRATIIFAILQTSLKSSLPTIADSFPLRSFSEGSCDVRLCYLISRLKIITKRGNLVLTQSHPACPTSVLLEVTSHRMALVNRCIARSLLIKARSTWSKGVHQFQNARPCPGHVRTFMPSIAKQAKYEGELPKLGTNEFVVFSPEVSGRKSVEVYAFLSM